MNLSNTDTRQLIRLLEESAKIISSYASDTKEANVARKCRVLRKKIIRKQCTTK